MKNFITLIKNKFKDTYIALRSKLEQNFFFSCTKKFLMKSEFIPLILLTTYGHSAFFIIKNS